MANSLRRQGGQKLSVVCVCVCESKNKKVVCHTFTFDLDDSFLKMIDC
jgi:hypothetical protein